MGTIQRQINPHLMHSAEYFLEMVYVGMTENKLQCVYVCVWSCHPVPLIAVFE